MATLRRGQHFVLWPTRQAFPFLFLSFFLSLLFSFTILSLADNLITFHQLIARVCKAITVNSPAVLYPFQYINLLKWAELEWKRRWLQIARNKEAATWKTPWGQGTVKLYSDLPKHQATALFLLRSEVIDLNGRLASINVPGIDARCSCGWRTQSGQHVLMMCPLYSNEEPSW